MLKLNLSHMMETPFASANCNRTTSIPVRFPPPYKYHAVIRLDRYETQIQQICSKRSIPKEIKQFVIENISKMLQTQPDINQMPIELITAKKQYDTPVKQKPINDSTQKQNITASTSTEQPKRIYFNPPKDRKIQKNLTIHIPTEQNEDKLNTPIKQKICPNPCSRPLRCQQNITTEVRQSLKSTKHLTLVPKTNNNKKSTSRSVHQKLHNLHMKSVEKIVKQKILEQIEQNTKCHTKISTKQKQFQPFQVRLEKEVARRRRIAEDNQLIPSQTFRPKINQSNSQPKVYEFLNKSIERKHEDKNISPHPRCNSKSSILIQSKQDLYLQRLVNKLFKTEQTMQFNIQSMELLTDQQFKILCPFLKYLENNRTLNRTQFKSKFNRFYQKLTVDQKYTLKFIDKQPKSIQSTKPHPVYNSHRNIQSH